jgi:SAM-dependent methyltransferase
VDRTRCEATPSTRDSYCRRIRDHPEVFRQDVRDIRRCQPSASRILDVGCGHGGFLDACRTEFEIVLGLDLRLSAVRACHERGVFAIRSDALRMPLRTSSIDVVRAEHVIEHLSDPLRLLNEAHRVLRAGGLFLAYVPSQYSTLYPAANFYDDYTHIRPLSRVGALSLLEDAGFEPLAISGYTLGRNAWERLAGRLLAFVIPHGWRIIGARRSNMRD